MFTKPAAPQPTLHRPSYNENLVYIKAQMGFIGQRKTVSSNELLGVTLWKQNQTGRPGGLGGGRAESNW